MDRLERLVTMLIHERKGFSAFPVPPVMSDLSKLFRSLLVTRPPLPADDSFLSEQDAFLEEEAVARGIVQPETIPGSPSNPRLRLWRGDIRRLAVDAIVNAANSALLGCFIPVHNCIDNAIHCAAGVQLRLACHELMVKQGYDEPTGSAQITPGFNLPAKHVIHTVGPVTNGTATDEDCSALASCYHSCLKLADANELDSLAFCCISTGEFKFPKSLAAEIAVQTVREYLNDTESGLTTVIFTVYTEEDHRIYASLLA